MCGIDWHVGIFSANGASTLDCPVGAENASANGAAYGLSANGAAYDSLGQRPRSVNPRNHPALKGRSKAGTRVIATPAPNRYAAPSGLELFSTIKPRALPFGPRAMPWATLDCPFGAANHSANGVSYCPSANGVSIMAWLRHLSAKGAAYDSLGQRPRSGNPRNHPALKGRSNGSSACWVAPSGLELFSTIKPRALPFGPRAMPWATLDCPFGAWNPSAKGAAYDSLGQRPRYGNPRKHPALKGRSNGSSACWVAPSGLELFSTIKPRALPFGPRAMPWATLDCPFGAWNPSAKGAAYDSLGQRPRLDHPRKHPALKGRSKAGTRVIATPAPNRYVAPSGLGLFLSDKPRALPFGPGAMPWATLDCPFGAEDPSANGAPYSSLGQRPRFRVSKIHEALKGRSNGSSVCWIAPSGLESVLILGPRVSPWATLDCPFGAEDPSTNGAAYDSLGHRPRFRVPKIHEALKGRPFVKRAVLERQVNANLEGMGYGG